MSVIDELVGQLGVDPAQARGGVGLLLNLAKAKLGEGEFGAITQHLEGAESMMGEAPETGGGMAGMLGGLGGMLGGKAESLGQLAEAAGGFRELGMNPDMVMQFIPIISGFLQQQGGTGVQELLEAVLQPR